MAGHLLMLRRVTSDNFMLWGREIFRSKDKANHSFVKDLIEVGVGSGFINLENFTNWYKAIKSISVYKSEAVLSDVISGLKLSENLPLYTLISWGNIFALNSDVSRDKISNLILEGYCPNSTEGYPSDLSLQDTIVMIVVDLIQSESYFPGIVTLMNMEEHQESIKNIIFQYLLDNKISRQDIAQQFSKIPQILSDVKIALSYIKFALTTRSIADDDGASFFKMLEPMNPSAKHVVLNYIFAEYIVSGNEDVNSSYQKTKYLTQILSQLVAVCKDLKSDDAATYQDLLCKISHYGISNNIINLTNASEWLDIVKANKMNCEFYAELYYNIGYGIVSNSANLETIDLKLWQDLVIQKFFSIETVRDGIVPYKLTKKVRLEKSQSLHDGDFEKKMYFLANGLFNQNSFILTIANMIYQKAKSSKPAPSLILIDAIKVIIKEPNLKLSFLAMRIDQITGYFAKDRGDNPSRVQNRSDDANDRIEAFLSGRVRFSIPVDLEAIRSVGQGALKIISKNQLERIDLIPDLAEKSDQFFNLFVKQDFLCQIFDLHKINVPEFKLWVNALMIKYAFQHGIITPDKTSIMNVCQKTKLNYDDLLHSFFHFSFCEENFPLQNIIKWINLFAEIIPTEYSVSKISEIYPSESAENLHIYYLCNTCLKSMYHVDEVMNREVRAKVSADNLDQLKAVIVKYYIEEEQLSYFSELSEEDSLAMVNKIWVNQDLTIENLSDKFAEEVCKTVCEEGIGDYCCI